MNRILFLLFSLSFFIFQFGSVHAQGVPVGANSLELTASTDSPAPDQKVSVRARSYTIDIDSANITWSVNGKIVQKGIGLTSYEVTAPALGKETTVTVQAISSDGITVSKSISIISGSIDLIVESNGHTPPMFSGKLPISYQNTINIIAIPHLADSKGVEYDPKNLVYEWKRNSRTVEDESGFGKQSFNLTGEIVPRDVTITVTASTRDGKKKVSGYINVSYTSPSLNFYVDDPLYGPLYNKILDENIIIGKEKEVSVIMEPYGFNKPTNGLGNLDLTWMINNYEKPELSKNQSVTLRAPENTSGTSNIELSIKNKKDILQSASANFTIKFNSIENNNN